MCDGIVLCDHRDIALFVGDFLLCDGVVPGDLGDFALVIDQEEGGGDDDEDRDQQGGADATGGLQPLHAGVPLLLGPCESASSSGDVRGVGRVQQLGAEIEVAVFQGHAGVGQVRFTQAASGTSIAVPQLRGPPGNRKRARA